VSSKVRRAFRMLRPRPEIALSSPAQAGDPVFNGLVA
jgi:hypothetical protein